eukprot:COSAG04_NODE_2265_length_4421_cov_18.722119_2_plen_222_part_00
MSPRGPRGDTGPADYEQHQVFQKVLKKCAQGSVPSPVPAASLRPTRAVHAASGLQEHKRDRPLTRGLAAPGRRSPRAPSGTCRMRRCRRSSREYRRRSRSWTRRATRCRSRSPTPMRHHRRRCARPAASSSLSRPAPPRAETRESGTEPADRDGGLVLLRAAGGSHAEVRVARRLPEPETPAGEARRRQNHGGGRHGDHQTRGGPCRIRFPSANAQRNRKV